MGKKIILLTEFESLSKEKILDLIIRADIDSDTVKLIKYFDTLKKQRVPFFLNKDDLEKILMWKLKTQYGRQRTIRTLNNDNITKSITKLAFEIEHPDKDYEIELKIGILTSLRGIAVPIASAILTIIYPCEFAVIDFRNGEVMHGAEKSSYTVKNYIEYLKKIRELAKKHELSTQKIDLAMWQYHRENSK